MTKNPKVGIIMGSDTDLAIFAESGGILEEFGIPYEITVASAHRAPNLASAHRNPEKVGQFATTADKTYEIIIAGAGKAAHLPGVIASMTTLPVIGVPTKAKTLDGLDSLLSTAQMPPGVPVATVGINAGKNAGILAVQILATSDKNLEEKLVVYKNKLEQDNKTKGEKLGKIGYKKYLDK